MPAALDSSTITQLQEARAPALQVRQGDIGRVCRRRRGDSHGIETLDSDHVDEVSFQTGNSPSRKTPTELLWTQTLPMSSSCTRSVPEETEAGT